MLSTRPLAEIPSFNNVQNEIFDMVKPVDSMRITLKDLINWFVPYLEISQTIEICFFSGQGGLVLSILVDISSFWTYEVSYDSLSHRSTKVVV